MSGEDPVTGYCETVIRFVASQMLDPHRYFEQKLLGQLALSDTGAERARLLQQLVAWIVVDKLLTAAQRAQLDAALGARRWPSMALADRDPELALLLLRGAGTANAGAALQRALGDPELNNADRGLVQACLHRHRE